MIKLTCFKAGKGDSFLLSTNNFSMLIDAGTDGTYRFIQQELANTTLNSIVVTHVDYDHIGGFFKLLQDSDNSLKDLLVFINTPSLLLFPDDSDMVGIEHGVEFNKILLEKGLQPLSMFVGSNLDNIILLKDLNLQILSPPSDVLDELLRCWTSSSVYQKYLIDQNSDNNLVSHNVESLKPIEEIIKNPPQAKKWQKDLLNSASIAFIASCEGKKIVFLADANPDLVCKELDILNYTKDNKVTVDLIKISHHGSKHNTTKNLLERFNCSNYLISTNNSGPYYHPNRETIILISEYGRLSKDIPLNIYTNYELDLRGILTSEEQTNLNLNFKEVTTLEYY